MDEEAASIIQQELEAAEWTNNIVSGHWN
jgi:hypothetical protein